MPTFKKAAKHSRPVTAYRSGLEAKISAFLTDQRVDYRYEELVVRYGVPAREATYTPDWVLGNGIIIEGKGLFEVDDRKKHLLIKHEHPGLDIRFVFTLSKSRIYKTSPTTYADWCNTNGFLFADRLPPLEWLHEEPTEERMEALKACAKPFDLKAPSPTGEPWATWSLPTTSKKGKSKAK